MQKTHAKNKKKKYLTVHKLIKIIKQCYLFSMSDGLIDCIIII